MQMIVKLLSLLELEADGSDAVVVAWGVFAFVSWVSLWPGFAFRSDCLFVPFLVKLPCGCQVVLCLLAGSLCNSF